MLARIFSMVSHITREQAGLLIGAVAACSLAVVLLWRAGLPQPAQLLAVEPAVPGELPVAPIVGARAPDFVFTTADGERVRLTELRGLPVIVNFWATWCGPCVAELPGLQAVYEQQGRENLRVLAINVDEPPALFVPWAAALGLTFAIGADEGGVIQRLYAVRGTPQTVVIDAAGTIQAIYYGVFSPRQLVTLLEQLSKPD